MVVFCIVFALVIVLAAVLLVNTATPENWKDSIRHLQMPNWNLTEERSPEWFNAPPYL